MNICAVQNYIKKHQRDKTERLCQLIDGPM